MHGWLEEQVDAKKTKLHDKEWRCSQATDLRQRGQQQTPEPYRIDSVYFVVCVCFESGWRDGGGREGDGEGLTEVQAASFCYVLAHSWVWVSMNGFYQTLNGLIYAIKPRGCFSVAGDSQEYWKATTSSSFRTYILSMPNLVSTLFVPLTIFNIVCVLSHFLPVSSNSSGPASSEEFGAAEKHELGIYPACCFISLP